MSGYGEILEPFEPELDVMYKAFISYFNNPLMTKIKNTDKYSMYMVKNYCLLSKECRYIVCLILQDNNPNGYKQTLDNMRWLSFQTRTLSQSHELESHLYNPKRGGILDSEISRIKTDNNSSTYKCDKFPFTITLLHTKNDINEYSNKGTVISALETYQTIIALT
jgi:hypothetical protein